jgi:hypothetical protein
MQYNKWSETYYILYILQSGAIVEDPAAIYAAFIIEVTCRGVKKEFT